MALQFRGDDTLTIALFTDSHWRGGNEEDRRSAALMLSSGPRPWLVSGGPTGGAPGAGAETAVGDMTSAAARAAAVVASQREA